VLHFGDRLRLRSWLRLGLGLLFYV